MVLEGLGRWFEISKYTGEKGQQKAGRIGGGQAKPLQRLRPSARALLSWLQRHRLHVGPRCVGSTQTGAQNGSVTVYDEECMADWLTAHHQE